MGEVDRFIQMEMLKKKKNFVENVEKKIKKGSMRSLRSLKGDESDRSFEELSDDEKKKGVKWGSDSEDSEYKDDEIDFEMKEEFQNIDDPFLS